MIFMRKYKGNYLTAVICNCCGKILLLPMELSGKASRIYVPNGIIFGKDGENHSFDVCEECYDRICSEFRYPVKVVQRTELL